MSATGYSEIIEYIAEECAETIDSADEVESSVNTYMESLAQAVKDRVEQLVTENNVTNT